MSKSILLGLISAFASASTLSAAVLTLQNNFIMLDRGVKEVRLSVPNNERKCLEIRSSFGYGPMLVDKKFLQALKVEQILFGEDRTLARSVEGSEDQTSFPLHYRIAQENFFGADFRISVVGVENFGEWLDIYQPYDMPQKLDLKAIVLLVKCPAKH